MGWYRLGLVVMGDQLLKQVTGGDRSRCVTQHALQRALTASELTETSTLAQQCQVSMATHSESMMGAYIQKRQKEAPPAGAIQLLQVTRVY